MTSKTVGDSTAVVAAQTTLWFTSAILSSLTSKHLHKKFQISSSVQTMLQMGAMLLCCRAFMYYRKVRMVSLKYRFNLVLVTSFMRICGLFFSQMSLAKMSLSFSQTVKALGPLVMVILSKIFFNTKYTFSTYVSVAFIVLGVIIASANETTYDIVSFAFALVSTCTLVSLSLLSKKLLIDGTDPCVVLAATTRFSIVFAMALVGVECWSLTLNPMEAATGMTPEYMHYYFMNLVAYSIQCISAIVILKNIKPLSYSIANIAKRICVVLTSIIIFQNEVSVLNGLGMTITMCAVAFYNISQTQQKSKEHRLKRSRMNTDSTGSDGLQIV